jgi:hypothetical protein
MTGAVCPACGVAVVPGYVRCPKCHRALPRFGRSSSSPVGGTSLVKGSSSPTLAIVAAIVIGGGIIGYFAFRGGKKHATAAPAPVQTSAGGVAEPASAPAGGTAPAAQPAAAAPNPDVAANDLQRSLERARLWSTVSVVGDHVDVRSGSCADPAMKPALEPSTGAFKAAGLTKLRCLDKSGSVVFTRDF